MTFRHDLTSYVGRRSFDEALAGMLRAQDYAQAEAVLTDVLETYRSPLTALCLGLPHDGVRVDGWAHFNERLSALSKTLPATAVWLNLSNQTDDGDDGLRHPGLEIGYLKDGKIAFSRESRASLLAMSATYPAPWTGSPDEDGFELTVTGLGPLNDWLVRWENDDESLAPSVQAAEWFQLLRYHQAIARKLQNKGLVLDIPVLVGGNSIGPWCVAVLYRGVPFKGSFPPTSDPRKRAKLEAEIAYQIDAWETVRASCTISYPFGTADYLIKARGIRHMADNWFVGTPFEGTYPLEMDEANFAHFLQRWRHYRDPDFSPPPPPPLPLRPTLRKGLFGRRGL